MSIQKVDGRKAKSLFINMPFQMDLIAICIWPLIFFFVSNVVLLYVLKSNLNSIDSASIIVSENSFLNFMSFQFKALLFGFVLSFIITMCLFMYLGFRFSHRVAGPLYRLEKNMREMRTEKKLFDVKFRDKDYFQNIKEEFNKFIAEVKIK